MIRRCYLITVCCCIALVLLVSSCTPGSRVKPDAAPVAQPHSAQTTPAAEKEAAASNNAQASGEQKKPALGKVQKPGPLAPESLAIVLQEGSRRGQRIADALQQLSGKPVQLFFLNTVAAQQQQVLERLQRSAHRYVVAIGSTPANRVKQLRDKKVVFSQVFNYQADGLLAAGFSGVSMVPSTRVLIQQWKKITPDLARIAVVTGPDNEHQMAQIKALAQQQQVVIEHFVVKNDKAMLYTVKQAGANIKGFWLLPDNRVLSRRGIKAFMSYAVKHNKQVAVFNRHLLKPGGLFYVTANADTVAKQILNVMQLPTATVMPLDDAQIEVNRQAIERLSLNNNVF